MKLKALIAIQTTAEELHLPNAVFEASAETAKYLVDHGYAEAIEAEAVPEAKKAAEKKAKPAAPQNDDL